jgi:predicted alpha-1,6-mannanase (GH76 family)
MLINDILLLVSSLCLVQSVAISARDPSPYYGAAEVAFRSLQTWYDTNTGLYDTTNWWNAANAITVICDLLLVDGNIASDGNAVIPNTFSKAQTTPAKLRNKRGVTPAWSSTGAESIGSFALQERGNAGFLNFFYDDEAWWALAWIQAYDVTQDTQYLDMANSIYADLQEGWTGNCTFDGASGGGMWWNKGHEQINAIGNGLYLSVAAHLANRAADNKQSYVDAATDAWHWMQSAGLQNSSHLITDKLNLDDCTPTNGDGWSYNQGVVIGGLVELNQATGDSSYLDSARAVADGYIKNRNDFTGGIAVDNCEPDGCSGDQTQFKGVFMRNLAKLWQATKDDAYKTFIIANADSIVAHDTQDGKLGLQYTGPYQNADASTQSSAMDALVAAIVVTA